MNKYEYEHIGELPWIGSSPAIMDTQKENKLFDLKTDAVRLCMIVHDVGCFFDNM